MLCYFPLDINDLVEILDLLKRNGYSRTDYYELGLYLGLLPGTLNVIKENNKGDVKSCLRECLTVWLQQADDVKSVGGPSYYSLIQALRKLGENAVADRIDRQSKNEIIIYYLVFFLIEHPSCVILARYKSDQSVHRLLPEIVSFLHKEGIIKEMVLPATAEAVMDAVKEFVCADHNNLHKFAEILKEITSTVSVGVDIAKEYSKLITYTCSRKLAAFYFGDWQFSGKITKIKFVVLSMLMIKTTNTLQSLN